MNEQETWAVGRTENEQLNKNGDRAKNNGRNGFYDRVVNVMVVTAGSTSGCGGCGVGGGCSAPQHRLRKRRRCRNRNGIRRHQTCCSNAPGRDRKRRPSHPFPPCRGNRSGSSGYCGGIGSSVGSHNMSFENA